MILNVRRRGGVTLLEIVLSTSLMVPMMGMLFWFYSSTLEARAESAEHVRRTQLARVIVDRMARELRQATGFSGGYGTGIYGTRNRVSINTVVIPDKALVERRGIRDRRRPGQFDLRQIDYYIAWDEVNTDDQGDPRALGLVRRERKTFNQLSTEEAAALGGDELDAESGEDGVGGDPSGLDGSGGAASGDGESITDRKSSRSSLGRSADDVFDDELNEELDEEELEGAKHELYAPELKFVEFFFHDGTQWWDSWEITEGNALPQMVMITVGYEPELPDDEEIEIIEDIMDDEDDVKPIPDDRYVRIVRIPQADSFFLGPRLQREMSSMDDLDAIE